MSLESADNQHHQFNTGLRQSRRDVDVTISAVSTSSNEDTTPTEESQTDSSLEATEADLFATVFPHPTISEGMHEAALDAFGRALHT